MIPIERIMHFLGCMETYVRSTVWIVHHSMLEVSSYQILAMRIAVCILKRRERSTSTLLAKVRYYECAMAFLRFDLIKCSCYLIHSLLNTAAHEPI